MGPRPDSSELKALFERYSSNGVMVPDQLRRFLHEVQLDANATEVEARKIMETLTNSSANPVFHKQDFLDYLFNTQLNGPINTKIHHDMKCPLSYYYVFTGHNSYLMGNQLNSTCSDKPIAEALRKGVRVVELDLWPNSKEDDILVYHGRTLTSPVDFKVCLNAIKENAFVKSDYPVIVTLEDHLPAQLQAKAAKTIVEIFGKILYHPEDSKGLKQFPSPESLRGRIMISTKPPKEFLAAQDPKCQEKVDVKLASVQLKDGKRSAWGQEIVSSKDQKTEPGASCEADIDDDEDDEDVKQQQNVPNEYKKIITIHAGKPKGSSLLDALKIEEFVRRVSLSESQLSKAAETNPAALVQFTHHNFLRIYPYGLRIDSSNYNPVLAWAHGAQMVAANMQGYGKHLWVAYGFFKSNGGCGYVKKPKFLLPEGGGFVNLYDPSKTLPVTFTLKVKVCTGYGWLEQFGKRGFDTFSAPDFYARVGIAGIDADTVMQKTATIDDNWTPVWEQEFEFPLKVPELAVLRVEVHESDTSARDDFAGQICLPVSELKPGYRVVALCDEKVDELQHVRLLLRIQLC